MPLIALAELPRALQVSEQLLEQICARSVKQMVSCVHKMHTNTTSMQAKPAEEAHIKKEKELTVLLEVQPRET